MATFDQRTDVPFHNNHPDDKCLIVLNAFLCFLRDPFLHPFLKTLVPIDIPWPWTL